MRGQRPNYLFNRVDWHSVQRSQSDRMAADIESYDRNKLLNTPHHDLAEYFRDRYFVEVPSLLEDEIVVDQREAKIDVSQDQMRWIDDRSQPFYITGTEVEITIPFDGDPEAFNIQPTTYSMSPPAGEIHGSNLILTVRGTDLSADQVRNQIDRSIGQIKTYLGNLKNNADGFNAGLLGAAGQAIERRRAKLLKDQSLVAGLGFPMKERSDAPRTYTAPTVRKKIAPKVPAASSAPYKPEPVLEQAHYEHILDVIDNMAQVMERSPSAFVGMDEESLRSHFLVQLNGHFEGSATGETFNYSGKTDILIRVEGKNIFIGECKFWGGPKKLTETIDQVLSYSSWRDTKVAVLVFSRNKNFSSVLEAIPETVEVHGNYKKTLAKDKETRFRFVFSHKGDDSREMYLTVMAFDVPSEP